MFAQLPIPFTPVYPDTAFLDVYRLIAWWLSASLYVSVTEVSAGWYDVMLRVWQRLAAIANEFANVANEGNMEACVRESDEEKLLEAVENEIKGIGA